MNTPKPNVVRVRSTRKVFAPVGSVHAVSKQQAAALVALGNAEIVTDDAAPRDTYNRRDMRAEEHDDGRSRKNRR